MADHRERHPAPPDARADRWAVLPPRIDPADLVTTQDERPVPPVEPDPNAAAARRWLGAV